MSRTLKPLDFLALLPPARRDLLRRRIEAEQREMERLFALPDRWLGSEILRLCRRVRASNPELAWRNELAGYNSCAVWDLGPEIARRLGCPLDRGESMDPETRAADAETIRVLAGSTLANVERLRIRETDEDLDPARVLFHEIANGNPIAIGLDRVAPPSAGEDYVARRVAEVSRCRGHEPCFAWNPALQDDPPEQESSPRFG